MFTRLLGTLRKNVFYSRIFYAKYFYYGVSLSAAAYYMYQKSFYSSLTRAGPPPINAITYTPQKALIIQHPIALCAISMI